jgi:hypothetical protein
MCECAAAVRRVCSRGVTHRSGPIHVSKAGEAVTAFPAGRRLGLPLAASGCPCIVHGLQETGVRVVRCCPGKRKNQLPAHGEQPGKRRSYRVQKGRAEASKWPSGAIGVAVLSATVRTAFARARSARQALGSRRGTGSRAAVNLERGTRNTLTAEDEDDDVHDARRLAPRCYSSAVLKYLSALSGRTVAMLPSVFSARRRAAQTFAPLLMPTKRP